MVRHEGTRLRVHVTWVLRAVAGGRPHSVLGTVPLPTNAGHQRLKRGGVARGRATQTSHLMDFAAVAVGTTLLRIGTVLAYHGT